MGGRGKGSEREMGRERGGRERDGEREKGRETKTYQYASSSRLLEALLSAENTYSFGIFIFSEHVSGQLFLLPMKFVASGIRNVNDTK